MGINLNLIVVVTLVVIISLLTNSIKTSVINDINADDYDENSNYGYYAGVPVYTPSRQCSMVGGICVLEQDCAPGQSTSQKGLCSDKGVECCYQVNQRAAPCGQYGGVCMKSGCTSGLRRNEATDCQADEQCCVLVY